MKVGVVGGSEVVVAYLLGLIEGARDEALAAEARVDRHEKDDVELVHHVLADVLRLSEI